jgi:hypothetical protein
MPALSNPPHCYPEAGKNTRPRLDESRRHKMVRAVLSVRARANRCRRRKINAFTHSSRRRRSQLYRRRSQLCPCASHLRPSSPLRQAGVVVAIASPPSARSPSWRERDARHVQVTADKLLVSAPVASMVVFSPTLFLDFIFT